MANTMSERAPIYGGLTTPEWLGVGVLRRNFVAHLKPEVRGEWPESPGFRFHRVEEVRTGGISVEVNNEQDRLLKVSCYCEDQGWDNSWIKWHYAKRQTSDKAGGSAVADQDAELSDGLQLLLKKGEQRFVTFDIQVPLNPDSVETYFVFALVIEEVGSEDTGQIVECLLEIKHSESQFLKQLPSIYQQALDDWQEAEGLVDVTPFFSRYLSGFEDFYSPLSKTVDAMDRLFGPFSTPPDFLLWLGSWVCARFDSNWPEIKRRKLVADAVELYRYRGTKRGLSHFIELYTGFVPTIDDQPVSGMKLGKEAKLGKPGVKLGDIPPHCFVVTVAVPDPKLINQEILHEIIRYEKPAHTAYALRVVQKQNVPRS